MLGPPILSRSAGAGLLLREDDQQGKPTVYWLGHGTNLLRAAPHHVKPVLGDLDQLSGMNHALDALRNLRGRGVTRFWDLQQLNQGRRIEEVGSDEEAMDDLNDQSLDMSGEEVSEPPQQRRRLVEPGAPVREPPSDAPAASPSQESSEPQAPPTLEPQVNFPLIIDRCQVRPLSSNASV